jgi:hypothetical protein
VSRSCSHHDLIRTVTPSALGCEECLKTGSWWVHLGICRLCGHVGCCDQSPGNTPPSILRRADTRSSRVTTRQRVGAGVMSTRHSSSLITARSSSVRYRGSHHEGGARSIANSPKAPDVCPTTHRRPPRCFPDRWMLRGWPHFQYGNEAPGRKTGRVSSAPEKIKRCKIFARARAPQTRRCGIC